jgi:hypothetical protein
LQECSAHCVCYHLRVALNSSITVASQLVGSGSGISRLFA